MTDSQAVHRDPSGRSSLWRCGNIKVLKLQGSSVERALHHGELLKSHLTPAILHYFSEKALEPFAALPGLIGAPARRRFFKWVRTLLEDSPAVLRDEVQALACGAGLPEDHVIAALCGPDLGTLANSWMLNPAIGWARLRFGCTTVSGQSPKGDFVLARNLDFPGVGIFDKNPSVVVHLPSDGSELKRIAIAADGVHFASISAVNESGIGLVVHQNFTRLSTARSMPLLFIGDWILRQARTLNQAIELLRKHRPGPMWTFVFFDLHSGETVAIEASRDHFNVRKSHPEWGGLAQSNHCLADDSLAHQLASNGTYINSCRRLSVAEEACRSVGTEDLVKSFAKVLAWSRPEDKPDLSIYDDIIKPITIQSVIFKRPSDAQGKLGRLLVTQDAAPASSGTYIEFDLDELFKGTVADGVHFQSVDLVETSMEERAYQERISQASRLSFDERRDQDALTLLSEHHSPGSLLMRAVLAHRTGDSKSAFDLCTQALQASDLPVYIRQSLMWVQAVALEVQGRRSEAQALADRLCKEGLTNTSLTKSARRLAGGQRLRAHERNLIFDFFAGDLVTLPQAPEAMVEIETAARPKAAIDRNP